MVTLRDVALACGVSAATVSRALNGRGKTEDERYERIRQQAVSMGYRPNAAARALKTNRSFNIGILYEDVMSHEYFSSLIDGLRDAAEQKGYDLTFLSRPLYDEADDYATQIASRGLDGIVVLQADFLSPRIQSLCRMSWPMVFIDHRQEGHDCVLSDNRQGMEALVNYAAGCGLTRVALLLGEDGLVSRERLQGYYKACAENGLRVYDHFVCRAGYRNPAACLDACASLLSLPCPPEAVLFPDDFSLLATMTELGAQGVMIPRDLYAAGYDGIAMSRLVYPRLTTYSQNTQKMADTVIDVLHDAITRPEDHVPSEYTVQGSLTRGETLRPLSIAPNASVGGSAS